MENDSTVEKPVDTPMREVAKIGEFEWGYTVENGAATITDARVRGSIETPARIAGFPVTAIGEKAFRECRELTSVTISPGVKAIGRWAFDLCYALESVVIPPGVETIGMCAFFGCALESVSLPASVTTVEAATFHGCAMLASIRVDEGNPFYRSVDGALYDRDLKTLIRLPGRRKGDMTIPASVTAIANLALEGCVRLKSVTLPPGLKSIGEKAFINCIALKSISIPASVTTIGEYAFYGCASLVAFHVDNGNPDYRSYDGALYDGDLKTLIRFPEYREGDVTLAPGLETIGEHSLDGCMRLKSVTLPPGVKVIYRNAFQHCTEMESVTLPEGLSKIGMGAFVGCVSLKSVTLPEGLMLIGTGAFQSCADLESVSIPSSVRKVGYELFKDCFSLREVRFDEAIADQLVEKRSLNGKKFRRIRKSDGKTLCWRGKIR